VDFVAGKKLNVGCGRDVRTGWVNLDRVGLTGVDVAHDLEDLPLPFEEGEFSEILCQDVLEHVDLLPLMGELHRILITGGTLTARVPHFTSENNFVDPTHKRFFSVRTFYLFVEGCKLRQEHTFDFAFSRVSSLTLTFPKGILLHNHIVEPLVNSSVKTMQLYEATALSRLFPAENVLVTLVK
jgi:SAM-dependent methyltransferase